MPLNERQLDALGKQHQEMLQVYSNKITALQAIEAKVTENIKNMNKVIDDHVALKQQELNDKIAATEKLKLEAITLRKEAQELLYTAQAKTEDANKIYDDMLIEAEAHDKKVKDHVDTVSSAHKDIDIRIGQCAEKEEKANYLLIEVNSRLQMAIAQEARNKVKQKELNEINAKITADIEVQKDLYFKNKQTLDLVTAIRNESLSIKSKADADMAEVLKIRDSLDIAQARITRTGQEIAKRNDECTAREIQNKVTDQQLKDRKTYLDGQEGRLNELKNNVATLQANLDKQAVPTEGA